MIFAYVYDLISMIFEAELKDKIRNIILYGSLASGEFDRKSDIDIFVDIWDLKDKSDIKKKINEQLFMFENKASRVWYPRGIDNKFSIIVDKIDLEKWKNIRYDMISNGIALYGKFDKMPEKTNHKVLITFSLEKLKQPKKMKFIRNLYGYEIRK